MKSKLPHKLHPVLDNLYLAYWNLANFFVTKYFGKPEDCDMYWVGGSVGGVLHVNDHFFNPYDMAEYLKYKYSSKDMFEREEQALECYGKGGSPISIEVWKKVRTMRLNNKKYEGNQKENLELLTMGQHNKKHSNERTRNKKGQF